MILTKILRKMGFSFIGETGLPDTHRDNCLQLIMYILLAILITLIIK